MRMLMKHPVRGLTMMEVLVAISVLSVGTMALLQIFNSFNQIRVVEKSSVLAIKSEMDAVEYFIRNPTSCVGGRTFRGVVRYVAESPAKSAADDVAAGVELLPGPVPGLLWLKTEHFRRLVECR